MSFINDCRTADYVSFLGANLIADEENVKQPMGLGNRNCEYVDQEVRTRRGFADVFNIGAIATTIYNWFQSNFNRLLYLTSAGVLSSIDLVSKVTVTVTSTLQGVSGMTFAEAGYRVYMSFFGTNGFGFMQPEVWDGTFTNTTPNFTPVFAAPPDVNVFAGGTNWAVFTEIGTGSVTAGLHHFALVFTDYNGNVLPPGPFNTGSFSPTAFTATGGKTLLISISPTGAWPVNLYQAQIAMTTVNNGNRWYLVPSTDGGGPLGFGARGSTLTLNFNINIDDVTLSGGGPTEITNTLFNLFYGTCLAHVVLAYNNRMVYIWRQGGITPGSVVATLFISDPYKPGWIIVENNQLNLPELRDITTAAVLGATLFVFGPSWIYAFTDNGGIPVQWSPTLQVSGNIGSPSIRGVTVNPGRGRMWICDHTGLFAFVGNILPEVPSSYWQQPIWDRINFKGCPNAICVKEYSESRLVIVKAPLDGSDAPTHLLVWDFTNGYTPGKIKWCGLWNIADFPNLGDIEIVANPDNGVESRELWVSQGDSTAIAQTIRRLKTIEAGDATAQVPTPLYDDNGNGIDSAYKILAVMRAPEGPQMQVGARLRLRGVGPLNVTAYSYDQRRTSTLAPITGQELSSTVNQNGFVSGLQPGQRFDRFVEEQSESISYQVDNGATPGRYFYWAAARLFYLPWMAEEK